LTVIAWRRRTPAMRRGGLDQLAAAEMDQSQTGADISLSASTMTPSVSRSTFHDFEGM